MHGQCISVPLIRIAECRRVEDREGQSAPDGYGLRTKIRFVSLVVFFCTTFAGVERYHDLEKRRFTSFLPFSLRKSYFALNIFAQAYHFSFQKSYLRRLRKQPRN